AGRMAGGKSQLKKDFSMSYQQLLRDRKRHLDQADRILSASEEAKRELTEQELRDIGACQSSVNILNKQIESIEEHNTLAQQMHRKGGGPLPAAGPGPNSNWSGAPLGKGGETIIKSLSHDYMSDFYTYIQSNGKQISAALFEGTNSAGGFAVP